MPKRPSFKPLLTPDGWMISIPESMSGTGKRQKRHFPTEKEAERFAGTLRTQYHAGLRGGTISPSLAAMAAEAAAMLEPLGLTILDAAKAVVERSQASQSTETFRERWLAYTRAGEQHWRQRYIDDMGKIPRWVGDRFMDMRLSDITPEIMSAALRKNGAKSDETLKARGGRVKAVMAGRGNKKRSSKVVILSARQLRRLKRHARENDDVRRVIGLLLFAGIRPGSEDGEISRMEWSAIEGDEIYIPHEVAKTSTDRHIPITPRLRWWIRGHPADGPVAPAGWKKKWQAIRKLAGIGKEQDITRHTFASHFLMAHGEDATKAAMGHSKGSDTLFRRYRRSVTKRAAMRYFRLANPHQPR